MSASLPYLPSPGSIKTALDKIRSAATPSRVTKDFVSTVLQIKGGTGAAVPPYLKRIGLVGSDGAPTELYKKFRNPVSAGSAIAEAIRVGYKDLSQANEYFYRLSDQDLLALIVQITGVESENRVASLTFSTLKALKAFASFETTEASPSAVNESRQNTTDSPIEPANNVGVGRAGLNLAYTINLNLPATSDQAVFNAIFRSLKEHLLSSNE